MSEQSDQIKLLVDGGKVVAGPLGPTLGPTGVNLGKVVQELNSATAQFLGMKVPVVLTINKSTRPASFSVEVGIPPASALIMKAAGIEKGSSTANVEKVADLKMEAVVDVAKAKRPSLLAASLKTAVKEILGTMNSMGVYCEGHKAIDAIRLVNEGEYDSLLSGD